MPYDEFGNWIEEEDPDAPKYPGFKALRSSDGSTYYVPSSEALPQGQTGTALSQDEIPIPYVSLPDAPKEDITPQKPSDGPAVPGEVPPTVYDVTPQEPVPETPAEQLEKLLPPKTDNDPWATAAERVRRRAPARPPEEEPPPPPSDRGFVEASTAPVRMGASKFLQHPGNLMYGIPAALTGLLADIEEKMPKYDVETPPAETPEEKIAERVRRRAPARPPDELDQTNMRDIADYLKELAEGTKKFAGKATGTEGQKPTTPVEKLGTYLGEYAQPTKGVSAGATVALAGLGAAVRGGLTGLDPSDIPIPGLVTEAKADPSKLFVPPPSGGFDTAPPPPPAVKAPPKAKPAPGAAPPAAGGFTAPPPMSNVPYQAQTPRITGEPTKKTKEGATPKEAKAPKQRKYTDTTVIPEGMTIPIPEKRITKPPNLKQGIGRLNKKTGLREGAESDEDFAQRLENAWQFKEVQARVLSPTATKTFETVNGYQRMPASEFMAVGIAGASLVGVALSGLMVRKFYTGKGIPNARPVADAAPGTMTVVKRSDLARTYDDINAALRRVGRRAGIDKGVVDRLMQTFRIQTRNGGRALADGAVMEGRMDTPAFRFMAPVSLKKMAEASTPQTDEYLKLLHARDVLITERNTKVGKAVESKRLDPSAPTRPVYEIRREADASAGQELRNVEQQIKDIEAAVPGIDKLGEANRAWNKEMTKFLESGEYGTLTKAQADARRMSQTNELAGQGDGVIAAKANDARHLIKERLDNEAIGKYVDETRKVDPRLFVRTSEEEIAANPAWRTKDRNVIVSFKRNGETEYYTTDPLIADVIRTDHHTITGLAGNTFYTTKRILEETTTGNLAPNFAVTSALRSYWIAKFTTEMGYRAPTAIGSVLAIPQQILPQLAKSFANGLERGSAGQLKEIFETGALGQFIGSGWMDGLARRLAVAAEESVYFQLKAAGSHKGSVLVQQHQAEATKAVENYIASRAADSNIVAGFTHFWKGWKATVDAVHNAPGFNFVKRNIDKEEIPYLAERARRLTGDPRTGGEMFVGGRHGGREIRYESGKTGLNDAVANGLVKAYGYTMDAAREAIPWWNPTLQGVKRIGEAWAHDPIRFARSLGMYAMAPQAALFYYAKHLDTATPDGKLGGDPNGRSYVDYMVNGRNANNKQMNFWIPLPGLPVERGIEFTFFHELNPFRLMSMIAMHHMVGGNVAQEDFAFSQPFLPADHITHRRTLKEDMLIAAHAFMETAFTPPMPPLINAALGTLGIRGPQGIFGGEAFIPKSDPFNQNGGLGTTIEITTRALFGGVAEAMGQFYANTINSTGSLIGMAPVHGLQGFGETFVKKTPGLRDATGILPDRSNNTDMTKEVFEHQKHFNELSRFYKKWDLKAGAIGVAPASIGGEIAVEEQLRLQRLNSGNPGLGQPDPDNPMYLKFMEKFYQRFMKETPNMVKGEDAGGVAFKSMFRNYGRASQKLERLKDVNYGTYDRWQRELNVTQEQIDAEQNPRKQAAMMSAQLARGELEKNGVDTTDRREVINFYRRMQYDALRVINYTRRAVEEEMSEEASQAAGRPVKVRLKDIKPYLSTMQNIQNSLQGAAGFMFPDLVEEFGQ